MNTNVLSLVPELYFITSQVERTGHFLILTDINFEDMNCNKSAHNQFASHLVVLNDTSYTCTFLQYTADLSWIMHNQAWWMRCIGSNFLDVL